MKRVIVVALALAVCTSVMAAAAAGQRQERRSDGWREVTCSYVKSGPAGLAGNVLRISSRGAPHDSTAALLRVEGRRLVVRDIFGPRDVHCSGARAPTIDHVDRVNVVLPGLEYNDLAIELAAGTLGPGVTPEPEGNSEIEISVSGRAVAVETHFDKADDQVSVTDSKTQTEANLNASDGDTDDDLTVFSSGPDAGARYTELHLGGGDDESQVISPPAGEALTGRFSSRYYLEGDRGSDTLIGDAYPNNLSSGPGDDLLIGRAGADDLYSGSDDDVVRGMGGDDSYADSQGADDVKLGRGSDFVSAENPGAGDAFDCGPDHDIAKARSRKHLRRCERLRRIPKPEKPPDFDPPYPPFPPPEIPGARFGADEPTADHLPQRFR